MHPRLIYLQEVTLLRDSLGQFMACVIELIRTPRNVVECAETEY